jgi:hypothetical protein
LLVENPRQGPRQRALDAEAEKSRAYLSKKGRAIAVVVVNALELARTTSDEFSRRKSTERCTDLSGKVLGPFRGIKLLFLRSVLCNSRTPERHPGPWDLTTPRKVKDSGSWADGVQRDKIRDDLLVLDPRSGACAMRLSDKVTLSNMSVIIIKKKKIAKNYPQKSPELRDPFLTHTLSPKNN